MTKNHNFGSNQGKPTFTIKDKFLYKEMAKEVFDTKNVNRATENLFIWSAFKYFLRQPTDTYILFSPIKYWKSQHVIDKTFTRGYICNRSNFNASEGGIVLIEWQNKNDSNECLYVESDLGDRKIYKIRKNPSELLVDSTANTAIAWLFNLSNIPKADNGKLVNDIEAYAAYCKVQKPYKLAEDNILAQVPLWLANCYEYADYTEREVIMKTADGGKAYYDDIQFIYKCFLWAGLSQKNKSLSRVGLTNSSALDKILGRIAFFRIIRLIRPTKHYTMHGLKYLTLQRLQKNITPIGLTAYPKFVTI